MRLRRRLRLLFVAKRFPLPPDTGGKIRTSKLLEQLSQDFDITLVSNVERPKDEPYLPETRRLCAEFIAVPWTEAPKGGLRFYLRVLRHVGSRYPVSVVFDYSPLFATQVAALVRERRFDLLVCDFVQPSVNLRDVDGCPVLLFQHNVESMIFGRYADASRN